MLENWLDSDFEFWTIPSKVVCSPRDLFQDQKPKKVKTKFTLCSRFPNWVCYNKMLLHLDVQRLNLTR